MVELKKQKDSNLNTNNGSRKQIIRLGKEDGKQAN